MLNKKWASHVVKDKEKANYYDELGKKYYQKLKENRQEIRSWFINLWNNVSKDGFQFKDNPYVQVITFQRKDI